jgi:hypothetical protein
MLKLRRMNKALFGAGRECLIARPRNRAAQSSHYQNNSFLRTADVRKKHFFTYKNIDPCCKSSAMEERGMRTFHKVDANATEIFEGLLP